MYFQELQTPENYSFLMIFSTNNHFLERIWSADTWDIVYFLLFAKCKKKIIMFHSLRFGGRVLSPPPYIT